MNKITNHDISFKQIEEGYDFENDEFGISSLYSTPTKKAFLSNPFLKNKESVHIYLRKVDGINAGISFSFPIEFKAYDDIFPASSGSTLEVYKDYRHLAIGAELMMVHIQKPQSDFLIFAGISDMALPLYKKLKYTIFEYPRAMRISNIRSIIESKGINGMALKILTICGNTILKIPQLLSFVKGRKLLKKFNIEKLSIIPDWIEDISLNDGHQFMEVHDRKWFQWNLDNNLHAEFSDKQSFYAVYKEDNPMGFFMTKERHRKEAGGILHNIIIGSIMEWGSADTTILSEADIYLIALSTFNNVDILEYATDNYAVINRLKKYGFIPHGYAHIAFKDLRKKYPEAKDIEKWRIRFGYADVLLT